MRLDLKKHNNVNKYLRGDEYGTNESCSSPTPPFAKKNHFIELGVPYIVCRK